MSEANHADDRPAHDAASDDEPAAGRTRRWRADSKVRMLISGILFLAAAVATFLAGDDNRWISIPAAIIAAVALVDFLSVNQRRRSE